jgi:hypothetical protein
MFFNFLFFQDISEFVADVLDNSSHEDEIRSNAANGRA